MYIHVYIYIYIYMCIHTYTQGARLPQRLQHRRACQERLRLGAAPAGGRRPKK